ncbi:MAG: hypothetical protein ABI548_16865 [Polyangiaceae bacterium]
MSATYTCRECGEDVPLGMACCGFREAVRFDESNARHMSLAPIDVGFDLRAHDMPIALPADVEAVRYTDRDGRTVFARGEQAYLAVLLVEAGYQVVTR